MKRFEMNPILAFAPAETALAASTEPEPVLEIVTFRLNAGVTPEQFLSAAEGTERLLRASAARWCGGS